MEFVKRNKWWIIGAIVVVGVIVGLTDMFGTSGPPVQ